MYLHSLMCISRLAFANPKCPKLPLGLNPSNALIDFVKNDFIFSVDCPSSTEDNGICTIVAVSSCVALSRACKSADSSAIWQTRPAVGESGAFERLKGLKGLKGLRSVDV